MKLILVAFLFLGVLLFGCTSQPRCFDNDNYLLLKSAAQIMCAAELHKNPKCFDADGKVNAFYLSVDELPEDCHKLCDCMNSADYGFLSSTKCKPNVISCSWAKLAED
jgi:hypothetical protein